MGTVAPRKASVQWHSRDAIEIWQAEATEGNKAIASIGIIGSLFDGLVELFKIALKYLKNSESPLPHYASLESSLSTLFFWGRDFGVPDGELDLRLQHSGGLRGTVLVILISIAECVSEGLVSNLLANEEQKESRKISNINNLLENARAALETSEAAGKYLHCDTEDICSTLRSKIDCLSILSTSLECLADDESDNEEARAWENVQERSAHEYFADLVSSRFPEARRTLAESLGRSNWNRYNHIQRQRKNVQNEPKMVRINDQTKSVFHDSGLGSSAPAQSVAADDSVRTSYPMYAATVVSSRAEGSHKRLPSLPVQARSRVPFQCEVCERTISVWRTKDWKNHIFSDICAYTCIFDGCSLSGALFEDREAMISHLESQHDINQASTSQICPLCVEQIAGGSDIISLHFARHMEEIALAVLPHSAESEASSEGSEDESKVSDVTTKSKLSVGVLSDKAAQDDGLEDDAESAQTTFMSAGEVARILLKKCSQPNYEHSVKIMLEDPRFDINARDAKGKSVAHLAIGTTKVATNELVMAQRARAIELLCRMKANLAVADDNGLTPLHWCVKTSNRLAVACLLNHCVPLNAVDEMGRTPLYLLGINSSPSYEIVSLLITAGGKLNEKKLPELSDRATDAQRTVRHEIYASLRESDKGLEEFEDNRVATTIRSPYLAQPHGKTLTDQVSSALLPGSLPPLPYLRSQEKLQALATLLEDYMTKDTMAADSNLMTSFPRATTSTSAPFSHRNAPSAIYPTSPFRINPPSETRRSNLGLTKDNRAKSEERITAKKSQDPASPHQSLLPQGDAGWTAFNQREMDPGFQLEDPMAAASNSDAGFPRVSNPPPQLPDSYELSKPHLDIVPSRGLSTDSDNDVYIELQAEREKVARRHPLYHAIPEKDGLYHCPREGEVGCNHKATNLKCNYDKYVDFHLKPFRCDKKECAGVPFTSTACLLRHEREAHGMHGHGSRPHLCHYPDCERSEPGHGFPRRYNLFDHMKRVHDYSGPSEGPPKDQAPVAPKVQVKRKLKKKTMAATITPGS